MAHVEWETMKLGASRSIMVRGADNGIDRNLCVRKAFQVKSRNLSKPRITGEDLSQIEGQGGVDVLIKPVGVDVNVRWPAGRYETAKDSGEERESGRGLHLLI